MEYGTYKKIPNHLRKYRKTAGFKQTDVAKILRLKNTAQISKWEKGKSLPSFINVCKLSILYRVLVDALFNDLMHKLRDAIREEERENLANRNSVSEKESLYKHELPRR